MKFFHIIGYILVITITVHFGFVYYDTISTRLVGFGQTSPTKYLTSTLFTVNSAGLGNALFEILAVRGVAKTTNRQAFVNLAEKDLVKNFDRRIKESFPKLYEQFEFIDVDKNILLKVPFHGECCIQTHPRGIQNLTQPFVHIQGAYFQSFKYFDAMREEIREWLRPAKKFFDIADSYVKSDEQRARFKICSHTRRGDFATDHMHSPTDMNFTVNALKFLIDEYTHDHRNNLMLVFLGNDVKFENGISDSFTDIDKLTLPKADPEIDLAFTRQYCDVVLITAPSSTFGWWLGYLSKTGEAVYYEDILETGDKVAQQMIQQDFYPIHWVKLVTSRKDGRVNKL